MNRFKFRVFDKILSKYIPWNPFIGFDDDNYIVEQWTGYKDKNNNDIYEGDMIKHLDGESSVNWNGFMFCALSSGGHNAFFWSEEHEIEIVGNIHVER